MFEQTRNVLGGLLKEGSLNWGFMIKSSVNDEYEELGKSPSGRSKQIPELSPVANVVVARCSKILDISMDELQSNFDTEASDSVKQQSVYARNFLEYCCLQALALTTQVKGYLSDKNFRRLTFDMMIAWEFPHATSDDLEEVESNQTVGREAFCRIAPAIPTIADTVTCYDLYSVLTASEGSLPFATYEKYISALDRISKTMKNMSESSLVSYLRSPRAERIVEVDGTVTTQPVIQHVGVSAWPGRLILSDHALYFEALRVVSYDKAKIYDLSDDLKQIVKPELSGPWGARLFDKAVLYSSTLLPEPVLMEFPELTGHSRRDYWLAIIREILHTHNFIRKFNVKGTGRDEILRKTAYSIFRIRALEDVNHALPANCENLLMFNVANEIPGGDLILEAVAESLEPDGFNGENYGSPGSKIHSSPTLSTISPLRAFFKSESGLANQPGLRVGEFIVGGMNPLERAVVESRNSYRKVELAQASVDGVKVEGLDTNLAVMKELLLPFTEIGSFLLHTIYWDDPSKSAVFCSITAYVICRGWVVRAVILSLLCMAAFMMLTRMLSRGRPSNAVKVTAPPPKNTMEQLLAVQNAIAQFERSVRDGNVVLLKLRALLLAIPTQATDRVALALVGVALVLAIVPGRLLFLSIIMEFLTRYSPPRRTTTERFTRRIKEWWFSIPAAPVLLEKDVDEKKRK